MANPVLKESKFRETPLQQMPGEAAPRVMTLDGTIQKTVFLFLLLIGSAYFGWIAVDQVAKNPSIPSLFFPVLIGAAIVGLVASFAPKTSPITGPLYALLEGYVLGMISAVYNLAYEGIVYQALMGTFTVFGVMLAMYMSGKLRATPKFKKIVIGATLGIFLTYLVTMIINLFGGDVPFIYDSGPLGIGFSLVVVVVASLNLILDFDFIENASASGQAPKYMEWYAGFGLMVTVVWLYLEILRLLAKLNRN